MEIYQQQTPRSYCSSSILMQHKIVEFLFMKASKVSYKLKKKHELATTMYNVS